MKLTVLDCCTVTKDGDLDFSVLEPFGEVRFADLLTKAEIIERFADTEGVLINKTVIDEELLNALPHLRYVGTFATGYNNVDTDACRRHGVTLCNVPDYSTHAVAEHTVALLLCFAQSLQQYIDSVAAGDWSVVKTFSYFPYPMREVYGKTLGIVGYGNIGKAVAKIADALGMRVLITSRTPKDTTFAQVDFSTLLRESDYVSLHCPLNKDNAKMMNQTAFRTMKRTAVLINTARGGLVDEQELADALNEGIIAGACLDVMTHEPMEANNPLRTAKHCLITPHVAWAPLETRERLLQIVVENIRAFLSNAPQNKIV